MRAIFVAFFLFYICYWQLLENSHVRERLSMISKNEKLLGKDKKYNCEYSTLLCNYQADKKFYIECYPKISHILYNKTECPSLNDSFLTGFYQNK